MKEMDEEAQAESFNEQEAVYGILWATVFATVEESALSGEEVTITDEMQGVSRSVFWMRLFNNHNTLEAQDALGKKCLHFVERCAQEESISEMRRTARLLVSKCKESLDSHLRETTFAHACNVAIADGVISNMERDFLAWLQGDMQIDPILAAEILEVTAIRNRA